ncbi:MAG: MFS transporter [Verrucomicrobia bacterium]|nr:MAG: MFS transporter [Verrucomicrobiota bacterium]
MSANHEHKTRTLWLTGALHAFTHVYQVALMPLYLLIQRDLKLTSVSQATLLVTVMMAGYFLPAYPLGVAADRFSRKQLLGWGLFLNALGFVMLGLSPNYFCALLAVLLVGFGGSFFHPSATAMIARLFPAQTGKALGLIGIGASVGFFVGPIYAGWRAASLSPTLGDAAWRRPVLELGLLGIVMAGVFAWLAKEHAPTNAANQKSTAATKLFPTSALWLLFFYAALAFSLRDFTGASMGSLGSLFLQNAHGYDPRLTGIALSWIFLPSAISNPLFGHLSDRGRSRWTMTVLLIAAVLVALFPHMPDRLTIPTFLVYGFFFMASYPMVEAALMESVPDEVRGRVFGLFITVGGLIGNASHWAVGAWVKHLGDRAHAPENYFGGYALLSGLIIVSLLGLPCLKAIRQREHRDHTPPPPDTAEHQPQLTT